MAVKTVRQGCILMHTWPELACAVLTTAFENCPDILKVKCIRICLELGNFILTLDSFVWILSGKGLLLPALHALAPKCSEST